MDTCDGAPPTRFEKLRELIKRITSVTNRLLPEDMGVNLRFINNAAVHNHLSAVQVENVMRDISPSGGTQLGTVLESRILDPFVYKILDDPSKRLKRPLLVCTITDGCPNSEKQDAFKNAILRCERRLVDAGYDPNTVMFLISQIGEDDEALQFIKSLKDDTELSDVIHCTTDRLDSSFKELQANERRMEVWLLEMLTKPLMGKDS
jgi:hypothetical protein